MARLLSTLLVASLASYGHAYNYLLDDPASLGAYPLEAATLRSVAQSHDMDALLMGAAALGEGGPNCSVSCNGEKYDGTLGGNKTGVDCWGTFKVFCKGGCKKVYGFGGFKCEGHFVGFKTKCGAKIGVCAGETKKFGKAYVKSEKGPIKIFKAGGGIGTSGVVVAGTNISLPAHVEWPSSLAGVEGLTALYEGHGHAHAESHLLQKGPYTLKKAFGDGAGGGLVAIKKLSGDDAAKWEAKHAEDKHDKDMSFEKLESKAERKLQKLGVHLPVEPSIFSLDTSSALEEATCEVTCNGKPAWFKGKFPCFGKFQVKCAVETEQSEDTLLLKKAGCNGFWSGIFGRTCKGFSYDVTAVKRIGKFAYCTGKKGIFAKKKGAGFVAGGSCFGKALYAVQYTPESEATESA